MDGDDAHYDDVPAALRREVAERYGLTLGAAAALSGGDEALLWRVDSGRGPLVVRLSPTWRTEAELAWTHDLLAFAARTVAEAVAPLPARDGATLFTWVQRPVSLFPFVDGVHLDRDDAALRDAAARLLARLHAALRRQPGRRPRPPSGPGAPGARPHPHDPDALIDPDLDAWHAAWTRTEEPALLSGPIHGDFYRRNLLCRDGRIVGLLDWDDARLGAQFRELAWSTWELSKVGGDNLDIGRAVAFLDAYRQAGGHLPDGVAQLVIPLIRWNLREEIRQTRASAAVGIPPSPSDLAYTEAEIRAFQRLRGLELPPLT